MGLVLKSNKINKKLKYLSFDEWNKLIEIPKEKRDDLILNILYQTGCTVNELVNIQIKDFDFNNNLLKIKKENSRNHESRIVYISETLIDSIKEFIDENNQNNNNNNNSNDNKNNKNNSNNKNNTSNNYNNYNNSNNNNNKKSNTYLFFTRQSSQMTTKRVCQLVQKICKYIGIKKSSPQLLRYTHIVHAYQKNIPLDAIQKQVGLKRSRAIELFGMLPELHIKNPYKDFLSKI